jgi:hypothetical protein
MKFPKHFPKEPALGTPSHRRSIRPLLHCIFELLRYTCSRFNAEI